MSHFQRLTYLYIPVLALLALTLLNFHHNRIYLGTPLHVLPDGDYKLMSQRCTESGTNFDYGDPVNDELFKEPFHVADMLFYDGAIERIMKVDNEEYAFIFGNNKCFVRELNKIYKNAEGVFAFSAMTNIKIVPDGCSLNYTHRGTSYTEKELGKLKDQDPTKGRYEIVSYKVFLYGELYLLYEEKFSDYSDIGCEKSDRLMLVFAKVK